MARQQWTRGPVCGVDNCRSRLYRNHDGLTVCQFGHVLEGAVEFNDDQDQAMVTTRRLKGVSVDERGKLASQSASQRDFSRTSNRKRERLSGAEAQPILFRCLQILLKEELRAMIKLFFHDEATHQDLTLLVQTNWCKLVTKLYRPENGENGETWETGEQAEQTEQEEEDESDDDELEVSGRPRRMGPVYSQVGADILDLVLIIYVSNLQLQAAPLYLSDILQCIKRDRIPYFKTYHFFAQEDLDQLHTPYYARLQGFGIPPPIQVYKRLNRLNPVILDSKLCIPVSFYFPFIFKVLSHVLHLDNAPTAFMLIEQSLVSMGKTSFEIQKRVLTIRKVVDAFPEVYVSVVIIFILKLNFQFGNQKFFTENLANAAEDYDDDRDGDAHRDDAGVIDMSADQTSRYCDWVYNHLVPQKYNEVAQSQEMAMVSKRLFQIFNVKGLVRVENDEEGEEEDEDEDESSDELSRRPLTEIRDAAEIDAMLFRKLSNTVNLSLEELRSVYRMVTKRITKMKNFGEMN
ncbi:uncharacterized protein LODBEIA_P44210 [Lodderomyces beijingensis]|uniref:RRN7-type domain-containing protein n=1 Tax=Lodderomyces beijingensis TaxID=1775926 RepID=A0ABP0ZPZ0_9ASCO